MAAASSIDPMLDRIYEVLVDGSGDSHVLGAADRFERGTFPGQAPKTSSVFAHDAKRCWVKFASAEPIEERENASVATYIVRVRVDMSYYADHEADPVRQRAVMAAAGMDMHRVRKALGSPGNLAATEVGTPTGLASGALAFEGWDADDPDPRTRLMTTRATFVGRLSLTSETVDYVTDESGNLLSAG